MRRHIFPVVMAVLLLIIAREVYPYTPPVNSRVLVDGLALEQVASGFGGPTCMEWADEQYLLMCDRDGDRIILLDAYDDFSLTTLVSGLHNPHGLHLSENNLFISEAGSLAKYTRDGWNFSDREVLISGIPTGNHQTNAINELPNGTLVWHSGSTCNICDEEDSRNGALLWVNPQNGEHGILASGVRNSFDGVWVDGLGYLFTDNGRDWEGDHPVEEVNLLVEGASYGWPDDDPEHPVPEGTIGPIATWTPHTSMNGIDVRPSNSDLPGLAGNNQSGWTVYTTVYGSWNTVLPQGHEIVRIDIVPNSQGGYDVEETRFAVDLGTPLPMRFNPNGDLYYCTFGSDGTLYKISAE